MAKITASFDRRVTRDGYYLKVSILSYPDTEPTDLRSCLLINTRGAGEIVRCSTLIDLEKYVYVNPLFRYLSSMGNFNSLLAGDVIRFLTIPAAWEEAGLAAPLDITVDSSAYAVSYGCVHIDASLLGLNELPSGFNSEQQIQVIRGSDVFIGTGTYPIICGIYPNEHPFPDSSEGVSQIYSRRHTSVTVFPTVEAAMNMYDGLRAQIQALVDEANTSGTTFPVISQEVFE